MNSESYKTNFHRWSRTWCTDIRLSAVVFVKLSCSVTANRNDKLEKYKGKTGPGQVCQFRGAIEPADVLGKTWVSRFITSRAKVKSASQTPRIFLQVSINFSTARLKVPHLKHNGTHGHARTLRDLPRELGAKTNPLVNVSKSLGSLIYLTATQGITLFLTFIDNVLTKRRRFRLSRTFFVFAKFHSGCIGVLHCSIMKFSRKL